jgi:hypothetical protein
MEKGPQRGNDVLEAKFTFRIRHHLETESTQQPKQLLSGKRRKGGDAETIESVRSHVILLEGLQ